MSPIGKFALIFFGLIMLAPGLCGVLFLGALIFEGGGGPHDYGITEMILILAPLGIACGIGGIFMIRAAIRKRPEAPDDGAE